MKILAPLIGAFVLAGVLAACGSGEGSSEVTKPRLEMTAAEIASLPEIRIEAMRGPQPHKLVIHDLRQGDGAVMRRGDTIFLDWGEAPFGEARSSSPGARRLKFTFGKFIAGWEDGLPGMRVGGRRELIVPPRLGDTGVTTVYVVDLLGIEPG